MKLREQVREVLHKLRPLGDIKARYVAGRDATLIYNDRVFGVVTPNGLYIKSDEMAEAEFDRWHTPRLPRIPTFQGMSFDRPFRRIPEGAQHCPEAMIAWARLGIEVTNRETLDPGK